MSFFSNLILRKFKNVEARYEEIVKAYREFLLTEEELTLPKIKSILLPLDRYSEPLPQSVLEYISSYPGIKIQLVYVIDEEICRLIRETIGEKDSELFRKNELERGEEVLNTTRESIITLNLEHSISSKIKLGNKADVVEEESRNFDIIIISRHYGAGTTKTHQISPTVFRILQNVAKPVIIY
ncbi:hypothetical protein PNA2_0894 [Pyrococcus sp. NA2]|uniref:hypothetical protein n=1 Tax=Pyrococcus sp. (strain NA2) TaxID=342949 RepID=UPI000209AFFB|nr:hypothetical protein [Pyrococcus sp. NA2]AEC51810.1 hypothetical protein PNA2_0894 [Pyrococcus sp. NA2]